MSLCLGLRRRHPEYLAILTPDEQARLRPR